MASQAETEIPQLFERLVRHRDLSLFLPFILGFSSATNTGTPDQERIILINPFTQGMVLIDGLDSLFGELGPKNGHPPASKASIEALPTVDVGDGDDSVSECAICLEEWDVDDGLVVKEMPCKHTFHGNCIDKWLRIHGSCPVCRYKLPTDDEGFNKKMGQEDEEEAEGRRRIGREIWVSFSISSSRTRSSDDDSNQSSHQ
ncbi:E3 ubiquitin-protein ligase MPSR1-like [Mercurialis annua]|uniref:E3 ubiquitin-protein ligase MPSR1-like n=1 Tax=Mercurialis annua TaxID=3986 RepID=UPI00215F2359|nr:E3 ubiquitin-protein ligase MPSR1-like [Mercurialis annua]